MFNIGTLKTELINLVSWQQNVDATGWQITDTDLLTPTSGMYFNGVHPMLSFDNVRSIAPDFDVLHPPIVRPEIRRLVLGYGIRQNKASQWRCTIGLIAK
jgi:hypothetical protein